MFCTKKNTPHTVVVFDSSLDMYVHSELDDNPNPHSHFQNLNMYIEIYHSFKTQQFPFSSSKKRALKTVNAILPRWRYDSFKRSFRATTRIKKGQISFRVLQVIFMVISTFFVPVVNKAISAFPSKKTFLKFWTLQPKLIKGRYFSNLWFVVATIARACLTSLATNYWLQNVPSGTSLPLVFLTVRSPLAQADAACSASFIFVRAFVAVLDSALARACIQI